MQRRPHTVTSLVTLGGDNAHGTGTRGNKKPRSAPCQRNEPKQLFRKLRAAHNMNAVHARACTPKTKSGSMPASRPTHIKTPTPIRPLTTCRKVWCAFEPAACAPYPRRSLGGAPTCRQALAVSAARNHSRELVRDEAEHVRKPLVEQPGAHFLDVCNVDMPVETSCNRYSEILHTYMHARAATTMCNTAV